MKTIFKIFLLFLSCVPIAVWGQGNLMARQEIDTKKKNINLNSEKALSSSKEFIRLDSTYYVGWMLDGMYKYNHSADYQGYRLAAEPLVKSIQLLIHDYGNALENQYTSQEDFSKNLPVYQDYIALNNALLECYNNTDQPEKSMDLLDQIDHFHFRKDYCGVASQRAWLYHRFRTYTTKDFAFLRNSIAENEKMALDWCHEGLDNIMENKEENDKWFGPQQSFGDQLNIFHYLALLLTYNKKYDSSAFYYNILEQSGMISWNNYGGLQSELGNFKQAYQFFDMDKNAVSGNMLKEPYYYLPELLVYKGDTKSAIQMSQGIIEANGSKPGFGWYNLALARDYLYDGQLDSCSLALEKADNFQEVSIGTTLTLQQYKFTSQLLKVQLWDKKIALEKFLHKNWWYSPKHLFTVFIWKIKQFIANYVAVNALSHNADRDRMVYDLFCSESTTNFDEAWYLLKGFNAPYFIHKYEQYQRDDNRVNIQKYFKLFTAKFQLLNNDKDEAQHNLDQIVGNPQVDTDYEKLYLARLYEAAATCADKQGDDAKELSYQNDFLKQYSQLVPFSDVQIKMQLQIQSDDVTFAKIIETGLRKTKIDWKEDQNLPKVLISIHKGNEDAHTIEIKLIDANDDQIGTTQILSIPAITDEPASAVALKMFQIG